MIIEAADVRVGFGPVEALRHLSLTAEEGSITVLLGPNGAGKTTTTRVLTGVIRPDHGRVRVFGLDPMIDGEQVRRRCGVVSAKPGLYDRLSGRDNLVYAAQLYEVSPTAVPHAAATFGIEHALDQRVGTYSTGMKTRLALARAILHDPELLLLDEPTSGLDPESAAAVLDLIGRIVDDGRCVVMCTHLLSEADGLADQVVVMEQGQTLVAGSPETLARELWPQPRIQFRAEDGSVLDQLAGLPGVLTYDRSANGALVTVATSDIVPDLVTTLVAAGGAIQAVEPIRPSLEETYFAIVRGYQAGERLVTDREYSGPDRRGRTQGRMQGRSRRSTHSSNPMDPIPDHGVKS